MKEAKQWLDFAMDDLDSAEIMFKAGKYNMVFFFSHQAVEKALKASLVSQKHNPGLSTWRKRVSCSSMF